MSRRAEIGHAGEEYAARFLEQKGWRIVERNFRTRQGEIDLIVRNDHYLLFVEVKTRENARFSTAREAVTPAKQRRLWAAAEKWLQLHRTRTLQPRFDVIEVYWPAGAAHPTRVCHIQNAFEG